MVVLEFLFGAFALLGAIDRITGNHLKLGEEFEKGILSAGTLALAMVGMICIAPTLAKLLAPIFQPVVEWSGTDLSVLGGFIANDMGGASVAKELAKDALLGGYNGLVVASMMGVTICFTVPVALKTIDKAYHKEVLSGILCGIATIPIGCLVAGLLLQIPFLSLLRNLIPVLLISGLTCVGLILRPELCRKIFGIVGQIVLILITAGLGAGIFEEITGITLIPYMTPVSEGFAIVGSIAVILAGVFPLIAVISKLFRGAFRWIGNRIGLDDVSVLGLIASLANSIPMFSMTPKMNSKGRMMNLAFAVSASFVFGDHLAFTMAFDEAFLLAMIVGKLVGGISAILAAHFLYQYSYKKEEKKECLPSKN